MASWIIPVCLFLASLVVGLESWILLELIRLRLTVSKMEWQQGRLVSDVESEKDTRARTNEMLEQRIRTLEAIHHPKLP